MNHQDKDKNKNKEKNNSFPSAESSSNSLQNASLKVVETLGIVALAAMIVLITVSVIGRHIKIPVPGSVEIVEMLIVIVASTGILFSTVHKSHAAAKLFVERLPKNIANVFERIGYFIGAFLMVIITLGSLGLLFDVWSLHEETHLLKIPIVPFRLFFIACTAMTAIVLIVYIFSNKNSNK